MLYKSLVFLCVLSITSFNPVHADNVKGVFNETLSGGLIDFTPINGNPLTINVGADASFQVFSDGVDGGTTGQFFPSSQTGLADAGWLINIDGSLYAPSFSSHGGTATGGIGANTTFSNLTVSSVSGSGSTASPFEVISTADVNAQVQMQQTVSYQNGDNFFRKSLALTNNGTSAVSANVFFAGDIFLANSDSGQPILESNAPGGRTCEGITPVFNILFSAVEPAISSFSATGFGQVWSQIGSGALDGVVNNSSCIDNGAGIQWNVTIPANSSTTIQALTSFGDVPDVIGGDPTPNQPTSVPTNSTLGLLLLILACLTFTGFYIRKV